MAPRDDAGFECFRAVTFEDRHGTLGDDRPVIVDLVDPVNRDARLLLSRREHRAMHVDAVHPDAAELRQHRGMDVEDPAAIRPDRLRAELLQVAEEKDEVDGMLLQATEDGVVPNVVVRVRRSADAHRRDPVAARELQHLGVDVVADDDGGDGVQRASGTCLHHRVDVRAAVRGEHAESQHAPSVPYAYAGRSGYLKPR